MIKSKFISAVLTLINFNIAFYMLYNHIDFKVNNVDIIVDISQINFGVEDSSLSNNILHLLFKFSSEYDYLLFLSLYKNNYYRYKAYRVWIPWDSCFYFLKVVILYNNAPFEVAL